MSKFEPRSPRIPGQVNLRVSLLIYKKKHKTCILAIFQIRLIGIGGLTEFSLETGTDSDSESLNFFTQKTNKSAWIKINSYIGIFSSLTRMTEVKKYKLRVP